MHQGHTSASSPRPPARRPRRHGAKWWGQAERCEHRGITGTAPTRLVTLLLMLLVPLQGLALSLAASSQPAHYHRHADTRTGRSATHSLVAATDAASRHARAPARSGLPADTVLAVLDDAVDAASPPLSRARVPAERFAGKRITDRPDVAARTPHAEIGHHRHALDDPDVVYVDDGPHDGSAAKVGSDGMTMLPPTWPHVLPACDWRGAPAPPGVRFATRSVLPDDRPPAQLLLA